MLLKKAELQFQEILFKILSFFSYSNALIITYCENEDDYRFSLITSEIELDINDNKIKKIFQIPKDYLFTRTQFKIHTPTKQLIRLGKSKNFDDLKERFNIEVVKQRIL